MNVFIKVHLKYIGQSVREFNAFLCSQLKAYAYISTYTHKHSQRYCIEHYILPISTTVIVHYFSWHFCRQEKRDLHFFLTGQRFLIFCKIFLIFFLVIFEIFFLLSSTIISCSLFTFRLLYSFILFYLCIYVYSMYIYFHVVPYRVFYSI